jgi:pimeloyl-ACP methyl ester carboxylesterase
MRALFSFFFCMALAPGQPPAIVIGFVGGFVRHDNFVHSEVQLAAHLRADYPERVYAEVFENRHREKAHHKILALLGTNHDARVIIYGHSWGASETVTLARELERDGIPVRLTIQVDSVSKIGAEDSVIPPNVARAANFYQPRGLIRGRQAIRAADSERTRIIGNFRFDYKTRSVRCEGYPRLARVLTKPHIEIECDPSVWNRVESLIREELPAAR